MDTRHLIDAIVRQTTLLIAQLSTATGIRAPLARIADQVFLDLAREIEAQGVTRKVAADMFGLALRSYQKKIQRIAQSATDSGQTLWSAVVEYLRARGGAHRHDVLARFAREDPLDLGAVLKDLVTSGVVSSTGRGAGTYYEIASTQARRSLADQAEHDVVADLVWLAIYDRQRVRRADLMADLTFPVEASARAIDALIADGRVEQSVGDGSEILSCTRLSIPVGAEQGWEAAVFDHFKAVATAIAAKLRMLGEGKSASDVVGGSTVTFSIEPGHPLEAEVYDLLRRVRAEVNALWDRVEALESERPVDPAKRIEVTFYFGQNVIAPDDGEGDGDGDGEETP